MSSGVSFVVPVYNKADCIVPVLRQLARQVGDYGKQYIFVNDGSTDDSLSVVRSVTRHWKNTVIVSQSNHGSAHATNRAVSFAVHPFIKFVDADDQLTENATITLLRALGDTDACLSYGDALRDRSAVGDIRSELNSTTYVERDSLRKTILHSHFNPSQCLVKTDAVRAVGGCDERIVHSQEYSLSLRLAYRWPFVKANTPVVVIPRKVGKRLSDDQAMQRKRVSMALHLFFSDYPDVPMHLQKLGARRVSGRAWKYARRYKSATFFSRWFAFYLLGRIGWPRNVPAFIEMCCEAFD